MGIRRTSNSFLPDFAWNCAGFGLMCWLMGSGWSISRAKYYQIEFAQYQLQVGSALSQVQKVSDTLERTAESSSAIAPQEKQKIQQLTQESDAVIEQVQSEIEAEASKLTFIEDDL